MQIIKCEEVAFIIRKIKKKNNHKKASLYIYTLYRSKRLLFTYRNLEIITCDND